MNERYVFGVVGLVALALVWWSAQPSPTDSGSDPVTNQPGQGIEDLAVAIATAEGFGVVGAKPTRDHNPGDLELNGVVRTFPSDFVGWSHLYGQLGLIQSGASKYYHPSMSFADFARTWTATQHEAWLTNVLAALRARGYTVTSESPIADVLSV